MPALFSTVIKSGGADITKSLSIKKVLTDYTINDVPVATLRVCDGNIAKETFSISEMKELLPGADLEILGGHKKGSEKTIFKGIITGQTIGRDYCGALYLELTIHGDAVKMHDSPVTQLFDKDLTDDKVIKKIIGDSGATAGKVEASKIKHTQLVQKETSVWEYMHYRMLQNGFLFAADTKGKNNVLDPATHKGTEYDLNIGKASVEHFCLDVDATSQLKEAKASGWDIKKQSSSAPAAGKAPSLKKLDKANDVLKRKALEIKVNTPLTKEELTGKATGELVYRALDLYKGFIVCRATEKNKCAAVALADTVKLEGFGKTFNGKHFVSGVKHTITPGSWTVRIEVGVSLRKTLMRDTGYQGYTPDNYGLMIGQVASFKEDPEKLERIPVTIASLTGDKVIWARLASPFASKEEGLFLPPREKDEVVVGFWQGDLRYPVILGVLHNPVNLPPFKYDAKNEQRGLVLKEAALSMIFDEKEKQMQLKCGEKLEATHNTEKGIELKFDKTTVSLGEKMEAASDEISFDSKGDVKVAAKGKCALAGKGGTEVS